MKIYQTINQYRMTLWFAAVALTFAIPAFMSMHTGDDLGYMFADSVHHGGDGPRVTTLWQCFTTQGHHYVTTNGRFLVHVVVMAMLNLVPLWMFRVLNSIVFALLWLATVRLVAPRGTRPDGALCAMGWGALWICLPQPGLVLTTLVAYTVNYLWVTTAAAWWMLAVRRYGPGGMKWWMYVATFVLGTLHEGCSLPLCAAVAVMTVFVDRRYWKVLVALVAGCAVEVFAPGNMAHAAQGGGFTLAAIVAKCSALLQYLAYSPVIWLLALGILLKRRYDRMFSRENIFPGTVLVAGLLLATMTFTSPRQLTFSFWCAVIIILRTFWPLRGRIAQRCTTIACATLTVVFIAFMCVLKYPVYVRYSDFMERARTETVVYPASVTHVDAAPLPQWMTRAIAPDPLLNIGLVTIGDRYTRSGLERLYGHPVTSMLPAAPEVLVGQKDLPLHLKPGKSILGAHESFAVDSVKYIIYP